MEFSNRGTSTYHRFVAHYVRSSSSALLRASGPGSSTLTTAWPSIQTQLSSSSPSPVRGLSRHTTVHNSESYTLYETPSQTQQEDGTTTTTYNGIAVSSSTAATEQDASVDAFMAQILLAQAEHVFDTLPAATSTAATEALVEQITDLFDAALRYTVPGDLWAAQGRAVFARRVRYFVARGLQIEMVLPAFPCKSSNGDKVASQAPDRGEELALRRLHGFVAALEQVYAPGGKMWVVSDGHVFSDCIGVDDGEVDRYTAQLVEMNARVARETGGEHRVGFRGLVDLFRLDASEAGLAEVEAGVRLPELDHHVATALTPEAEMCRRILMAGCACEGSGVRARIDGKDPAILALYRGFARFMLEDLDLNRYTRHMSKSQKRKASTKVAFEMILRNQAYSNLVELVFPHHVRLSIHAHKNSGPKFGIQLFDPATVRTTDSLDALGKPMQCVDLLHIPTPWHNSVVEVEGSEMVYVCKSKLARDAVKAGRFAGEYERGQGALGACFRFKSTEEEVASTPATPVAAAPVAAVVPETPVVARKPTPVVRVQVPVVAAPSRMQTPVKTPHPKIQPHAQSPVTRPKISVAVPAAASPATAQVVSPILARRGTLLDMDQEAAGEMGDQSLALIGTLADAVMSVVRKNTWVWGSITGRSFS